MFSYFDQTLAIPQLRLTQLGVSLTSYPRPFVLSPYRGSLTTVWYFDYAHLLFWFFFFNIFVTFLVLVFFFLALGQSTEARGLVRETRGFSRAQTGDLLTATMPLTWSVTMLIHASTHSTNFDENVSLTSLSFTVIAYQWGWNYFFPLDVLHQFAQAPVQAGHTGTCNLAAQEEYAHLAARVRAEYLLRTTFRGQLFGRQSRGSLSQALGAYSYAGTLGGSATAAGLVSSLLGSDSINPGRTLAATLGETVCAVPSLGDASLEAKFNKSRALDTLHGRLAQSLYSRKVLTPLLHPVSISHVPALSGLFDQTAGVAHLSQLPSTLLNPRQLHLPGNRLALVFQHGATGHGFPTYLGLSQQAAFLSRLLSLGAGLSHPALFLTPGLSLGAESSFPVTVSNLRLLSQRPSTVAGFTAQAAVVQPGLPALDSTWVSPASGVSKPRNSVAALQTTQLAFGARLGLGLGASQVSLGDLGHPSTAGLTEQVFRPAGEALLNAQRWVSFFPAERGFLGGSVLLAPAGSSLAHQVPGQGGYTRSVSASSAGTAASLAQPLSSGSLPGLDLLGRPEVCSLGALTFADMLGLAFCDSNLSLSLAALRAPVGGLSPVTSSLNLAVSQELGSSVETAAQTSPTPVGVAAGWARAVSRSLGVVPSLGARFTGPRVPSKPALGALLLNQHGLNLQENFRLRLSFSRSKRFKGQTPVSRHCGAYPLTFSLRQLVGPQPLLADLGGLPSLLASTSRPALGLGLERGSVWLPGITEGISTRQGPGSELEPQQLNARLSSARFAILQDPLLVDWLWRWASPALNFPLDKSTLGGICGRARAGFWAVAATAELAPALRLQTQLRSLLDKQAVPTHSVGVSRLTYLSPTLERVSAVLDAERVGLGLVFPVVLPAPFLDLDQGFLGSQWVSAPSTTRRGNHATKYVPSLSLSDETSGQNLGSVAAPARSQDPLFTDLSTLSRTLKVDSYLNPRSTGLAFSNQTGEAASLFAWDRALPQTVLSSRYLSASPALTRQLGLGFTQSQVAALPELSGYVSSTPATQGSQELSATGYATMVDVVGGCRRLRLTRGVCLPAMTPIHGIFGSKDVIHSWAIPGLGVKVDCIPGYNSHRRLFLVWRGAYWGQCMEVCGRYHHWMPLLVRVIHRDRFLSWCSLYVDGVRRNSAGSAETLQAEPLSLAWRVAAVV